MLEYYNCEVIIREDVTVDEFIDVIVGSRKYLPCLYVYNKIDQLTLEELDSLAYAPHSVVVSCETNLNIDYLVHQMWQSLGLLRVYTKRRGEKPEFGGKALIVRAGASLEHVCHVLHRDLATQFKYALVWVSTKYQVLYNFVLLSYDLI